MRSISPSAQLSGTIPVSKIKLNNCKLIGRNTWIVFFICSFKTLSDPGLLLFLRFFVAFRIFSCDIGWFISSFISTIFSSNSISWHIWSFLLLHVFKVLKKLCSSSKGGVCVFCLSTEFIIFKNSFGLVDFRFLSFSTLWHLMF